MARRRRPSGWWADPVLPTSRPVATVAQLTGVVETLASEHLGSSDNEHRFTQLQATRGSFRPPCPWDGVSRR